MPYDFAWAVKDEPSKNDYSHQEKSDGEVGTLVLFTFFPTPAYFKNFVVKLESRLFLKTIFKHFK